MTYNPDPIVAIHELPKNHNLFIGIVIVKYAYLEQMLNRAFYKLLGVPHEIGDLAVSTPRLTDLILRIEHLCTIKNIKYDADEFKSFRENCKNQKTIRDLFAHGGWSRVGNDKQLAVLKTRGKWDEQTVNKHSLDEKFKSFTPEAKIMSVDHLQAYASRADALIEIADRLIIGIIEQIEP